MRSENVHGYTFPNALTSFALEERSKDRFTMVILSLVVFITSDEMPVILRTITNLRYKTFVIKRLCTVTSYSAVQLTVSVVRFVVQ